MRGAGRGHRPGSRRGITAGRAGSPGWRSAPSVRSASTTIPAYRNPRAAIPADSASSAPSDRTKSCLPALAVPITCAPHDFASCTATCPPPAAACTSARSPARSPAVSTSAWCAVSATSGSAAACTWSTPAGLRANARAGPTTNSACAPAPRGWGSIPNTSSPGSNSVTPTASTTPDTSHQGTRGSRSTVTGAARFFQSVGFTPAARTATSTSPIPGAGRGSSTTRSTSIPPRSSWLIARIVPLPVTRSSLARPTAVAPWRDRHLTTGSCQCPDRTASPCSPHRASTRSSWASRTGCSAPPTVATRS
ncbi:Flagellar hook-length control protein FliK [Actinosynnema pretiosum subsp. pretiosum]|nr:Flagellar hook-length control protein FliK [Actinosynnema pretiosum subsp. pretiosum]